MDGKRDDDGFTPIRRVETADSASSRRRSGSTSGTSWFKRLSSKVSHSDDNSNSGRRRSSVGSVVTNGESDNEEGHKLSRWRSSSLSSSGSSSSAAKAEPHSPSSPTRRRSSLFSDLRRDLRKDIEMGQKSVTPATPHAPRNVVSIPDEAQEVGVPVVHKKNEPHETLTLQDLKKRKIGTRAVGFAPDTFSKDPPQRIPPISPAMGNIEFLSNGDLQLRHGNAASPTNPPFLQEKHSRLCSLAQRRASESAAKLHEAMEAQKHANVGGLQSIFQRTSSPSHFGLEDDDDDEEVNRTHMELGNVDGTVPDETQWGSPSSSSSMGKEHNHRNATPEDIYTRCCHLREIMPIRNILRQLKGQLAPIPHLRIANTKPTLVEIEAFSDFLTVVPVAALSIDNHILSDEMIRLIFVGLTRSRDILRISLRNTDMSPLGWQYLCSFLASCRKSLAMLDLSCSNPTEVAHRVPAFDRSDADWGLFNEALSTLGCLEDLNLSGTRVSPAHLKLLLHGGFSQGRSLGVAENALSHEDAVLVTEWACNEKTRAIGVDLSKNTLGTKEDLKLVRSLLTSDHLQDLKLADVGLHAENSEQASFITAAEAARSSLRTLDISGNPGLFPALFSSMASVLHRLPNLSQLKIDRCGLNNDNIVALSETLSHCHRLVSVSISGNAELNETSATALCVAVNLSKSICTVEADISDEHAAIGRQLAKYCMRNLENSSGNHLGADTPADLALHDEIREYHSEVRSVAEVINEHPEQAANEKDKIVLRIDKLRSRIRVRIQSLLVKRRKGKLTASEREATIRMFFLSTTLDRLRRELIGSEPLSEEKVNTMNVIEERPSLARQESLLSLKKLEQEEAASHKAYTNLRNQGDEDLPERFDELDINALDKIIGD